MAIIKHDSVHVEKDFNSTKKSYINVDNLLKQEQQNLQSAINKLSEKIPLVDDAKKLLLGKEKEKLIVKKVLNTIKRKVRLNPNADLSKIIKSKGWIITQKSIKKYTNKNLGHRVFRVTLNTDMTHQVKGYAKHVYLFSASGNYLLDKYLHN